MAVSPTLSGWSGPSLHQLQPLHLHPVPVAHASIWSSLQTSSPSYFRFLHRHTGTAVSITVNDFYLNLKDKVTYSVLPLLFLSRWCLNQFLPWLHLSLHHCFLKLSWKRRSLTEKNSLRCECCFIWGVMLTEEPVLLSMLSNRQKNRKLPASRRYCWLKTLHIYMDQDSIYLDF